jgi:hypothetical protein
MHMRWQGLEDRVRQDKTIARFGDRSSFRCLIQIGDSRWTIAMSDGALTAMVSDGVVMPQCDFALSGAAGVWARFFRHKVAPGDQDLFAYFRRREIDLTGDTRKFYAQLLVLKLILAHVRDSES